MSLQADTTSALSGATRTVVEGLKLTYNQSLNLGFNCAPLSVGFFNTYLGYNSARLSINGSYNTTLGSDSGYLIGSSFNTAIGFSAARSVTNGGNNTVIGSLACSIVTEGSNNTLVGAAADATNGGDSMSVAIGAEAVTGSSSVAIGARASARGVGAVAIGQGAEAPGSFEINIADRIVGHRSNDVTGRARYSVAVNADLTRLGGALAFPRPDGNSLLTSQSPAWCMYTVAGSNGGSDLVFRSANYVVTRITDDFRPGVLNFTGQHRCAASEPLATLAPGLIVVATGAYMDLRGRGGITEMDEAVPVVALCRAERDARVFGVVCGIEELTSEDKREFWMGSIVTEVPVVQESDTGKQGDSGERRRVIVNSVGEGGIWVCGLNGSFRNGDLITSSALPGVGMRQGDDVVRACTVGKATCDAVFVSPSDRVLIGCVYSP